MANEINNDEDVEIIVDDGVEQSTISHFACPLTDVEEGDIEANSKLFLYFIQKASLSIFSQTENV